MLLNISDEELIYEPGDADIERAVAALVVPPSGPFESSEEESFALLLKAGRRDDFLSVMRIPRSSRLPEYTLAFYDAGAQRAYRVWVPEAATATAILKVFRDGASPLSACHAHGFIWCDNTAWVGELGAVPPGIDEEAEEELEERACITIGEVVDTMFDIRAQSPELAELLEVQPQEDDGPEEPLPTRAESLAWMRVAIGEEALNKLHREYSRLAPDDTRGLRLARKEWAEAMRSLARLARDREQWNSSAELEMKWLELRLAFQKALPQIRELGLCSPPALLLEVTP